MLDDSEHTRGEYGVKIAWALLAFVPSLLILLSIHCAHIVCSAQPIIQ